MTEGPTLRSGALAALVPMSGLSPERLQELGALAPRERVQRGTEIFEGRPLDTHSVYLLEGEALLRFTNGGTEVIVGATPDAARALNRREVLVRAARAITDCEVVMLEDDAVDILSTWDQVAEASAGSGAPLPDAARTDPRLISGPFSLRNLRGGAFGQLPAPHIELLLARFERIPVAPGEVVIREGDPGEFYYVVETGRLRVERSVGGVQLLLAELKSGDAFGEESLVSEAKRNATVTATAAATLLRLGREDFDALLRAPLLRGIRYAEACERVRSGAVWLDVRYPSEYQSDRLPEAINVPLGEVRDMFEVLDPERTYVVYCQSGRRSAAAAFLFAQRGFDVWLLEGGLRSIPPASIDSDGTPKAL